jgi:hypothetical protein
MRLRAAQAAAPYVHPRLVTVPGDSAESAKPIIDGLLDADRDRIEKDMGRRSFLARKGLNHFVKDGPGLTPAEKAERETLNAWRATLPVHLRGRPTLREFLDDPDGGSQKPANEPGEPRRHPVAER